MEAKKEHTFLWKIENFSLCATKKGNCFKSPVFRAKSLYDSSWYISLYPRGHKESREGYMGCYLNRCGNDDGPYEIECEFEISILSADEKILESNEILYLFLKNDFFGWSNFCKKFIESGDTTNILLVRCNIKSNAEKSSLRSKSSGVTRFDFNQRSFDWNVVHYNFPATNTIHITVGLDLKMLVTAPEDDIKITFCRAGQEFEAKSVMCQISLLDENGIGQVSRQDLHFFETEDASIEKDIWEFPIFLRKSMLDCGKEKYLKDNHFTLKCKIAISNGKQTHSVKDVEYEDLSPPDIGKLTILKDYERLYRGKTHADVKLHVDGQIIEAHKNILSIRSPVFKAMFDTDMVENDKASVTIPDLDAETVNSLLEYMYIGSVEKLDYKIASKLIVAADKYSVLTLKEKCANILQLLLSDENVCDILVVADLIQHEVLKSEATNYIKNNSESVFISNEWNSVVDKNLPLATETVRKVSMLIAADRKKTENNLIPL